MKFVPAILANAVLAVAIMGYGNSLRRSLLEGFSRADQVGLTLLGGVGIVGTLLFVAGQVWFSRAAIVLIVVLGVVLGLRPLFRTAAALLQNRSQLKLTRAPAVIIAVVLALTAVAGLAAPSGDIKFDAIAYHLLGPRVWLHEGIIRPIPDESLTSFPALVEMNFAALMTLGGQRAPELFSVIALIAICLAAAGLARQAGLETEAAWWVVALILTMPILYRGAYGGFVDVLYSAFLLAAIRVGFAAEAPKHYLLLGILCGFAMGTKYNGLIGAALIAIVILLSSPAVRGLSTTALVKNLGIASAAAVVVAVPWYLRNWVLLGSPIYPPPPFLLHFFQPRYLPREAIQALVARMLKDGAGMGHSLSSFLLLPFHLTYHPANFLNGAGGIGLVPLALAPFGLFARRKDWFARALVIFILLQTIAWFFTAQEARYAIHVYVILAIFGVFGWKYVAHASPRIGRALAGLTVACSVSYGFFMIASARADDLHAVLSTSFAENRSRAEIPFLDSFNFLNAQAPAGKVLVLDPLVPTYYLDASYIKPVGRFGERSLPDATDLPAILSHSRAQHIAFVLDVRWPGTQFRVPAHPDGLALVFERDDQRVYAVKAETRATN